MSKATSFKSFLFLALAALDHAQTAPLTHQVESLVESFEASFASGNSMFSPSPLNESEAQALLKIIADEERFSHQIRQAAFDTLRQFTPQTEPHHLSYCESEEIPLVKEVPASVYAQIIQSMSISCVDVFIYDFKKKPT